MPLVDYCSKCDNWRCKDCNETFVSDDRARNHLLLHHRGYVAEKGLDVVNRVKESA